MTLASLRGFCFVLFVPISSTEEDDFSSIRLVGGLDDRQGRLEVYLDGRWGWIQQRSWDEASTSVVCRQLGLEGHNVTVYSTSFFGRVDRAALWLSPVFRCRGDEANIWDCPRIDGPSDLFPLWRYAVGIICQAGQSGVSKAETCVCGQQPIHLTAPGTRPKRFGEY